MTGVLDPRDGGPPDRDADDALIADVFDRLLERALEGDHPDLHAVLPDRPDLLPRVLDTWSLVCSVAGRREPGRPILGGYQIVRELGHGGMGTVYLARHEQLQREVAIKVLPQSLALAPRARARFLAEARALARLRHDHVVAIHRVVDHAEMLAFEMEYVDGPSLQQLLAALRRDGTAPQRDGTAPQRDGTAPRRDGTAPRRDGTAPRREGTAPSLADVAAVLGLPVEALGARSPVEYFVRLGATVARALDEVHRGGLVHRDVKPSNILLRRDGKPMLADFGLARDGDMAATQAAFAGTPLYAAPERLRDGDLSLDGRADVYSLGVTLYEAITLSPPYEGRSTQEVLRRIESGRVPPLRRRARHVPRDLQTVLEKAMELEPRRRYATAGEFADDLERLLALQPVRARPIGPLRRVANQLLRHRRSVLAAAAGAVLVGAIAWPAIASAERRQRERAEAAAAAADARLQLLSPACQQFVPGRSLGAVADTATVPAQVVALRAAAERYAFALAVAPDDAAVRREHAVVATALWLRTRSPAETRLVETARLDADLQAAMAPLPPRTRAVVDWFVAPHDGEPPDLGPPDDPGRFASGLLAWLLGDAALCERAWSDLDVDAGGQPLVDAGIGLLLAAEGAHDQAFPRLFHAMRSFPAAPALAFEFAAVALAMGDRQPARTLLAGRGDGEDDRRLQLLRADLLAAEGNVEAARHDYHRLLRLDPRAVLPRHRLARLALANGETAVARRLLEGLLGDAPDFARARLDLARICVAARDRAGYLAQARASLVATNGASTRRAAAEHARILHLGGFGSLAARHGLEPPLVHPAAQSVDLPPAPLFRPERLPRLEDALEVLAEFDRAAERARDRSPAGVVAHALLEVAARRPRTVGWIPLPLRALPWCDYGFTIHELPFWITAFASPLLKGYGSGMHPVRAAALAEDLGAATRGQWFAFALTPGDAGSGEIWIGCPPLGSAGGPGSVFLWSSTTESAVHTIASPDHDLMFGFSVAALGDLDGDGVGEVAIGAPFGRSGSSGAGKVFVHSGRDGTRLREFAGGEVGFGMSIAAIPDVDGDAHGDLAIGISPVVRNASAQGGAWIVSPRDGRVLHRIENDRAGVWFGAAVASVGDVDGDGSPDVAIGGNYGDAPGLVRVHDGRTGRLLHTFADESTEGSFGQVLFGPGDLDGDGCAEIVVTAPGARGRHAQPGRLHVYDGRTGTLSKTIVGDARGDLFGCSLCRLPDWRNRRPALAVGAARAGLFGTGYVRIFDLATLRPLQTSWAPRSLPDFARAMVPLGDQDRDGWPDLAVAIVGRLRNCHLLRITHFRVAAEGR